MYVRTSPLFLTLSSLLCPTAGRGSSQHGDLRMPSQCLRIRWRLADCLLVVGGDDYPVDSWCLNSVLQWNRDRVSFLNIGLLRLRLNIVICNTLISTCEKACQWQSALALLFNARQFQAIEVSLWTCPCMNSWLAGAAGRDRNECILECMRLCRCLVLGMH